MSFAKVRKTSPNAATSHPTRPSHSAGTIADSDDLVIEILIRLPLKSLIRFKSVSKHWLSLISEPKFHRRHNRFLNPISGLFLNNSKFMYSFFTINGELDYVNLDKSSYSSQPPIKSGDFGEYGFRIVQSSNGLFLCSRHLHPKAFGNFVCNPITKKCTPLPRISWHWRDWSGCIRIMNSFSLSLAFDPWESSQYKVVCVRNSDSHKDHYQIQIYSSETRRWWLSGDPFYVDYSVIFNDGVFLNGRVHWPSYSQESLYFDVRDERLITMPMPMPMPMPIPPTDDDYKYKYFGESRGHLHLAHYRINSGAPRFDVYEMEVDCSGWFVKFRVNFSTIHHAFPMTLQEEGYYLSALCVVRGVSDKESYVVMEIPGAMIQYNFNTEALEKICDTQRWNWKDFKTYFDAHQYLTTLA